MLKIYDTNHNNAYDCHQYWLYYGPSFEYQVNDWNVESLDELTEMIPMECPDIPGFCS